MGFLYPNPVSESAVTKWLSLCCTGGRKAHDASGVPDQMATGCQQPGKEECLLHEASAGTPSDFLHLLGDITNSLEVCVHHKLGLHCAG